MLIACNTRFLIKNKLEGIGWFSYESLKRIVETHPEHQFAFFFDRPFDPEFICGPNVKGYVLNPPARHPWLWNIWFEWSVPRMLRKLKADIFISPDGFASMHCPCKQLVVIHDLAFEHFNDHIPTRVQQYYRKKVPLFSHHADRLATVSSFTKKDIVERYHIAPEKIDVVYNGSNPKFRPLNEEEKIPVKEKFSSGRNYFVYAGAIHPRKNAAGLFRSFDLFKKETGSDMKLLIAGRKAWSADEAMKTYEQMQYRSDVIFLGHLERDELTQVLAAAFALVYVSLFEGFGIPIVEAMNCNVPVITSHTSSMPEVAGNAALLVNPKEDAEIFAAMKKLYEDGSLRNQLIEAGKKQGKKFNWEKTGDLLWESVLKTI